MARSVYVEIMGLCAGTYYWLKKDEIKIKRKWKQIMTSGGWFTNKLGKTLKILDIDKTEYGFDIKVELPYSYTVEDLEKDLPIIREAFGYEAIDIKAYKNICTLHCIVKKEFLDFQPHPLFPNKLLIAQGLSEPIIVDMNSFPHVLIGGDVGTGKSRLLFCILTNLIATTNQAEIHLLQLRKNDLEVFASCRQVKSCSKTLDEVLYALEQLDAECRRREPLIDPKQGIYSIVDYNDKHKDNKLKYCYTVFEEFSFLNTDRGDSKEELAIKRQCLKHVKQLVNVGRSCGMFVIIALQKPTADSLPSDIKAQLTTRISLRIDDPAPSIVIMGNDKPTELKEREVMVRTLDRQIGHSYTIDHDLIMNNIKNSIINKPKKTKPKKINQLGKIGELLNEANQ